MAVPEDVTARGGSKKSQKTRKTLLIAQELKLARVLAGNNKTGRQRALKSLQKWFQSRSKALPFSEEDLMRIWKGLFYSMWMSDKPLVQEECAENIANLIHDLPEDTQLLFFKCGLKILINEWVGIDQLRLDKFLMLVRRLLRQAFVVLKKSKWAKSRVANFTSTLSTTILDPAKQKPLGLVLHFIEIYLEELAKVSGGRLGRHLLVPFLTPFIVQLAQSDDYRLTEHIRTHIFFYLMRQSDLGLEYKARYGAWRQLQFPGSINSMKRIKQKKNENQIDGVVEKEEEKRMRRENGEKGALDPRAGRVDVVMEQLKFDSKALADELLKYKLGPNTNPKSRKALTVLAEKFRKLAKGQYPLGTHRIQLATPDYDTSVKKAVKRLVKFEQKTKDKRLKDKRKRKKEQLNSINFEQSVVDGADNGSNTACSNLDEFIQKSEGHLTANLRQRKRHDDNSSSPVRKRAKVAASPIITPPTTSGPVEYVFRRNSGLWFVTPHNDNEKTNITTTTPSIDGTPKLKKTSAKQKNKKQSPPSPKTTPSIDSKSTPPSPTLRNSKRRLSLPELMSSPPPSSGGRINNNNKLVTQSLRKLAKKNVSPSSILTRKMLSPIRKNFVTVQSTPTKKVKINMSLSTSQEVDEHIAQVKSSPAIPYDANKQPTKSLLKSKMQTPINPFYKLL